jgi:hypothetical protein
LRARYFDESAGRFRTLDSLEGDDELPVSENKYAYANENPINMADPSGLLFQDIGNEVGDVLKKDFSDKRDPTGDGNISIKTILSRLKPPEPCKLRVGCSQRPDLVDYGAARELYEIKPDSQGKFWEGIGQLMGYVYLLNLEDPA